MGSAQITVCSLDLLDDIVAKTSASHVISLINHQMMPKTPELLRQQDHLKLPMNDISSPVTGSVLPSLTHVRQLTEFVINWDQARPLVIHCWAGISRSTAAAYIALCVLNPVRDEAEIALMLRRKSPTATPNRLLISCADQHLERDGRMIAAIEEIGRGSVSMAGEPFSMPAKVTGGS